MVDRRGKSVSSAPSTDHSPAPSSGGGPKKVAIPRLPKSEMLDARAGRDGSMSRTEKNRVSHACEPCRQRKTKCSGERPNCRHCEDFKIPCFYGDGKRDRAKNEMLTLQTKVENYEKLLGELSLQVDGPAQLAIQKAIGKTISPSRASRDKGPKLINSSEGGEAFVSAEVGSTGSNDHITDDIFAPIPDSTHPIGYMGKNSDMVWITNAAKELSREVDETNAQNTASQSNSTTIPSSAKIVQESNLLNDNMTLETPIYHMDNADLSVVGDNIDPYVLPEKCIADALVKAYFDTVHPTFPIVLKQLFMVQFESFYKFPFTPDSSKRWLAILNAIFAIGAVYGQMTKSDWYINERAHTHYFARARVLALDGGVVYEVADSQQVQVAGLMGLYLLATNQTNRAWNITGLAVRYAQALGLHLRSDVTGLSESEREMRVRIWYAIHNLERLLTIMTGRPSAIQEKDCSVPLPRPIDESAVVYTEFSSDIGDEENHDAEPSIFAPSHRSASASVSRPTIISSPNQTFGSLASLYFVEHTKLAKITVEALNTLYCPETMKMSWLEVQNKIANLESRCTKWRTSLPSILDFGKRQRDQQLVRQRMTLALHYFNTRIIINRPCLCKMDARIPNESLQSKTFNRNAALACIEAARGLIGLIPDEPNPVGLYSTSPWWYLLHYLVSAGAVVIVEIAMRAEHSPEQADGLFSDAQKVVNWLKVMGKDSVASQRSADVLSKLLSAAATKIGHTYQHFSDSESPKCLTKPSPMVGVEQSFEVDPVNPVIDSETEYRTVQQQTHLPLQGNPLVVMQEAPLSDDSTFSDLAFLTAFDDYPIQWNNLPTMSTPSISSMFPTPQQMQGINVEVAALSRRQSDVEVQQHLEPLQQQDNNHRVNYQPGWDHLMHFPLPIFHSSGTGETQFSQVDPHYPITQTMGQVDEGVAHPTTPSSLLQNSIPQATSPGANSGNLSPPQLNYHKQIREDILRRHSAQERGRKRRESLQ